VLLWLLVISVLLWLLVISVLLLLLVFSALLCAPMFIYNAVLCFSAVSSAYPQLIIFYHPTGN
jgi:hypothetical protein